MIINKLKASFKFITKGKGFRISDTNSLSYDITFYLTFITEKFLNGWMLLKSVILLKKNISEKVIQLIDDRRVEDTLDSQVSAAFLSLKKRDKAT